jgi:hypothetical protein
MDDAHDIFEIRPPLRASTDVNSQIPSVTTSPNKSPFMHL